MIGISISPTPWAVRCPIHGRVYLTRPEYRRQLENADKRWLCPWDGMVAEFDDDNYEVRS